MELSHEENKKTYTISPKLTKSIYDEETWSNTLQNGNNIDIIIISYWRWAEFGISISSDEYKKLKKLETIVVSDFDYEFYNSDDCRCKETIIKNQDKYTDEELKEINELIGNPDNCDEDPLEENGWVSTDVKYVITDGCDLVEED